MTANRSTTPRGFSTYDEFADSYGHAVTVRESSSAHGPRVWIFCSDQVRGEATAPHLDPAQAIRVRDALDTFLAELPVRFPGWWEEEGRAQLAEAGDAGDATLLIRYRAALQSFRTMQGHVIPVWNQEMVPVEWVLDVVDGVLGTNAVRRVRD